MSRDPKLNWSDYFSEETSRTKIDWSNPDLLKKLFGVDRSSGFIVERSEEIRNFNPEYSQLAINIKTILNILGPKEGKKEIEAELERLAEFTPLPDDASLDEIAFALRDLAFIQNAILHCDQTEVVADKKFEIPNKLAKPLVNLAERLGIPPLMSYPLYILYNAKKAEDDKVGIRYDARNTFTSSHSPEILTAALHEENPKHNDEAHFIRIHLGIEVESANLFQSMFEILSTPPEKLTENKKLILDRIEQMTQSLDKMTRDNLTMMYFGTGKEAFNDIIRTFLQGTKKLGGVFSKEDGFMVSNHDGGSGAQTPLFMILDAFLGNEQSLEVKEFRKNQMEFILPSAKNLIKAVEKDSKSIMDFVKGDIEVGAALIGFTEKLVDYRDAHMRMVSKYIGGQQGTGGSTPKVLINLREGTRTLGENLQKGIFSKG